MPTPSERIHALKTEIQKRGSGCVFVMQDELATLFEFAEQGAHFLDLREQLMDAAKKVKVDGDRLI